MGKQTIQSLFPSWCYHCHQYIDPTIRGDSPFLCRPCEESLPLIVGTYCQKCGGEHSTVDCATAWAKPIDQFRAVFWYEAPIHQWIVSHKYSRDMLAGRVLRYFITRWFNNNQSFLSDIDCLIPVPVHVRRLFFRGFNQTTFLLGAQTALSTDTSILKKIKPTPHQAGLSKKKRSLNLEGSFTTTRSLADLDILLFDDVRTTGQTIFEIAGLLRSAGASSVSVLCLAMKE